MSNKDLLNKFSMSKLWTNATRVEMNLTWSTNNEAIGVDTVLDMIQIIVNCFLTQIVGLLGSLGSIFTIMVLYRNGLQDTTNMVLISMGVCDLIYLLTLITIKSECIVSNIDQLAGLIHKAYATTYLVMFSRFVMICSMHHTFVIAIERFIAVFFPFQAQRWITCRKMKIVLALFYIPTATMVSPFFYSYTMVETFSPEFNRTVLGVRLSDFYVNHKEGLDILNSLVLVFVVSYGELVVVISSCIAITYKLTQASKKRSKLTSNYKQSDVSVSKMMLVVCLLSIVASLYTGAIFLYIFIVPGESTVSSFFVFLLSIDDLIRGINSSANFLIYIRMSSKFYRTWEEIVMSCRPKCCQKSNSG